MLKNKTVVLGVTGSISAYKIANLASMLSKQGCDIHVIMTKNATNFINPITFETLTKNKCIVDTFDRDFTFEVEHIALAKKADVIMVAPASANIIGKVASGIADDMISTTIIAAKCPVIFAPAMNTGMYENSIVQDNIAKLKRFGYKFIEPDCGMLACKDIGKGKLPPEETLFNHILITCGKQKDLEGKKVLVTGGPTRERIDSVRYITNYSSGKMGYSIARECILRGAQVVLVSGPTNLEPFPGVQRIKVTSADEMFDAVSDIFPTSDIIIKAAAVADYRPETVYNGKIKKQSDDLAVKLTRTKDILKYVGENKKDNQYVCGFSMETENLVENSTKKLNEKHCDMIVANNLKDEGAGFQGDTNVVTIITKKGASPYMRMSKELVAEKIVDEIIKDS